METHEIGHFYEPQIAKDFFVRRRDVRRDVLITVSQHWGGHQKVKGREGDRRPLGEGLLGNRQTRHGGRVGM